MKPMKLLENHIPVRVRQHLSAAGLLGAALLVAAACSLPAMGADLEIVKEGKAPHLIHPEPDFVISSEENCVLLRDHYQTFMVNARLGSEFTLKIRMAVEDAERSAASLSICHGNEWSNFIFSGSALTMFAGGKVFSRETMADIKSRATPQFILDGAMFDIVLAYRTTSPEKADLTISINGEPYVQQSAKCPVIESVGLRPWAGVIRVESMTLSGNFEAGGVTAKHFEPPAKK